MSVDLSRFHQVFFEESLEGLDVMENALMELDPAEIDKETINAIFRSAHSIKGGSATFGFTCIAEFTHVLETLLDQVRAGKRGLSPEDVNLFLQSVDCMREMILLNQAGDSGFTAQSKKLKLEFEQLLSGGWVNTGLESVDAEKKRGLTHWRIHFKPGENILKSGNDPIRIFASLAELGTFSVSPDAFCQPSLKQLDPESVYLSWNIELVTEQDQSAIAEIFEWVADESTIEMVALEPCSSPVEDKGLGWKITFTPALNILATGNEPSKIIAELKDLGTKFTVVPQLKRLPKFKLLDPEQCYLIWEIELEASVDRFAIEQIFEWVMDDCELDIVPLCSNDALSAVPNESVDLQSPQDVPVVMPKKPAANKNAESSSIRVGIDKIDSLINMVGELVITQSMLGQLGADFDASKTASLLEGLNQLEQNTRELQESVMRIRMLPISFAFSRFPRMVRDLGQQLGKRIHLEMRGEHTELDKTVMEKIGDPLVHLVRNAIDHGIEMPTDRVQSNKSEVGTIVLNAYHQGGNVVIEISDDGRGLDSDAIAQKAIEKKIISDADKQCLNEEQIFDLIFQPGFSTAENVSDLSGRGVGMDVVRRNIQALNGVVEVTSKKGQGSKICIRLPLTLAILDGQLVRVANNVYVFPLVSIVESIQCHKDKMSNIAGGSRVFKLRDDYVPVVDLSEIFSVGAGARDTQQSLMVVVEADGEKVGVVVDELLAQQQVVIKSLEQNYHRIEGVSGATILGDGTVALIIDIIGVTKLASIKNNVRSLDTSHAVMTVH